MYKVILALNLCENFVRYSYLLSAKRNHIKWTIHKPGRNGLVLTFSGHPIVGPMIGAQVLQVQQNQGKVQYITATDP